ENLRFIYHLVKEKSYTLEGAKKILKSHSNEAQENYELLNTLRSTRQFLVDIRNELDDQNPQ
ncbi:MAG: MerR family transcriptional regulator, partial [Bacteroidetes bacterium SW_10_40_5]